MIRFVHTVSQQSILFHQKHFISTIRVKKFMVRGHKVFTFKDYDTIKSAAKLLEKERIGALMVEDENKKIVGILTARDMQQAVAECNEISSVKAKDVMTPRTRLETATESDSLADIASRMIEKNIRHIPVMKGDICEGMLSIKDVVREILELERQENKDLQDIVTDSYSYKMFFRNH
eukprot:178450_1